MQFLRSTPNHTGVQIIANVNVSHLVSGLIGSPVSGSYRVCSNHQRNNNATRFQTAQFRSRSELPPIKVLPSYCAHRLHILILLSWLVCLVKVGTRWCLLWVGFVASRVGLWLLIGHLGPQHGLEGNHHRVTQQESKGGGGPIASLNVSNTSHFGKSEYLEDSSENYGNC